MVIPLLLSASLVQAYEVPSMISLNSLSPSLINRCNLALAHSILLLNAMCSSSLYSGSSGTTGAYCGSYSYAIEVAQIIQLMPLKYDDKRMLWDKCHFSKFLKLYTDINMGMMRKIFMMLCKYSPNK